MIFGGELQSLGNSGRVGRLLIIIALMRRLADRVLRYETLGVQALARVVTEGAWLQ